jgi:DNA-directed RNA polymerase specialized sigma24 family protein
VKANATDAPHPAPAAALAPDQAVTALYQAHALGLIRLAVVMLGDRPAAEDVVQEAFCGLYRRWHTLSDTTKAGFDHHPRRVHGRLRRDSGCQN